MLKPISPRFNITFASVTINTFHANKGEGLIRHNHEYSHLTQCHSGSILVRKENAEKVLTKESAGLNLIAGEWHEIEALEDNTVFVNIFAEVK